MWVDQMVSAVKDGIIAVYIDSELLFIGLIHLQNWNSVVVLTPIRAFGSWSRRVAWSDAIGMVFIESEP